MLPSRFFRNTGLAPPFRSLITPHPSLPASTVLRLKIRFRYYSSSANDGNAKKNSAVHNVVPSNTFSTNHPHLQAPSDSVPPNVTQSSTVSSHTHRLQKDPLEPRLSLTFTCTAPNCSTRSSHTFTKRAYEKGVVLVECPGCKNR